MSKQGISIGDGFNFMLGVGLALVVLFTCYSIATHLGEIGHSVGSFLKSLSIFGVMITVVFIWLVLIFGFLLGSRR